MFRQLIADYVPKNAMEAADKAQMLALIDAYPESILSRENTVAHITASGFILNEASDKLLMVHHNIYNSWGWTGGHADGDEDLFGVALKEAQEETGVTDFVPIQKKIAALDIIPVWAHIKNGKPVTAHLHLNVTYLLTARDDALLTVKPDENSGVAWIPVGKLADYCTEPLMLPIYEKLIAHAKAVKN